MTTLQDIEKSCTKLSKARTALALKLANLNAEVDGVRQKHIAGIRSGMERVEQLTAETRALVEGAPNLFEKPKSTVLAGIKVGFQQGKERVEIPDVERTLARIEQLLPDSVGDYVQVERSPIRAALKQLPAAMLKRLHVTVVPGTDDPFVKPQDTDVEKLYQRLVAE